MLSVKLPEALEQRLDVLALKTGGSKATLASEAITAFIDELENLHLAHTRARKNCKSIPLSDVQRLLGLHQD
jgi:RHH-type transcriptional regulator, rel operon repressor / antitoxin RelB